MPFDRLWRKWDTARAEGRSPQDILADVSDDSLIELLAGGGRERDYEKDIIRTELRNRLGRRRRSLERAVDVAQHTRDEATGSALLARGAADLQEGVELVAEQAEDAVAAQVAEVTSEEAERVSGRMHAVVSALKPREPREE